MKQLYIIIFLFITTLASSQNDLLNQWNLKYVVVNNVTYNNNYNDVTFFQMEITEDSSNENQFIIYGSGACNDFFGTFTDNQNQLSFSDINFTLADCDLWPSVIFEGIYYNDFLNNISFFPDGFSYSITSTNGNQTLTLSDSETGNLAVYGTLPSPNILTRTWYLSRIEIPGNPTIQIPSTESPSLTITNNINPTTFRTTAYGEGECNVFMSDYELTLNNGDNIQLLDFSPTLGFCDSNYEDEYFIIIGNLTTNFSEFEIVNNGTTLNVTDLLGARLVFGDEPLSVSENELNAFQISLKNNPVDSHLNLLINQSVSELQYQIYSIDGKLINQAFLRSDSIEVEEFNSGLYFIRFSNELHQTQTIRFIKE